MSINTLDWLSIKCDMDQHSINISINTLSTLDCHSPNYWWLVGWVSIERLIECPSHIDYRSSVIWINTQSTSPFNTLSTLDCHSPNYRRLVGWVSIERLIKCPSQIDWRYGPKLDYRHKIQHYNSHGCQDISFHFFHKKITLIEYIQK